MPIPEICPGCGQAGTFTAVMDCHRMLRAEVPDLLRCYVCGYTTIDHEQNV